MVDPKLLKRLTTTDNKATIESVGRTCVRVKLTSGTITLANRRLPGLGPGGLGSAKDDTSYKCTENSLEYKSSTAEDGHSNFSVKLVP